MATRVPGVGLQRYTYADYADRVCRLAGGAAGLGLGKGERVGTFAWNSHRHMEVYFAAPLMGMVLHTVNIRLSAQDITYIVNHAGDEVLIVDASLWHILEPIRKDLTTVKHVIVMKDTPAAELPPGALDYEAARAGHRAGHRVAAPGGDGRGRHVLHLRHHRPPQGRASTPTARSTCTASPRPRWTCSASASAT